MTEPNTNSERLLLPRLVRPACPTSFASHRDAAAWMIRMGRALRKSNVPISPHISRKDNNANWETGYRLIAVGKSIAEKYGDETKEMRLRERLRAALRRARPNTKAERP